MLVANHLRAFEFRLCNVDKMPNGEAVQECLDSLLLEDENGNTFMMNTNKQDGVKIPTNCAYPKVMCATIKWLQLLRFSSKIIDCIKAFI